MSVTCMCDFQPLLRSESGTLHFVSNWLLLSAALSLPGVDGTRITVDGEIVIDLADKTFSPVSVWGLSRAAAPACRCVQRHLH